MPRFEEAGFLPLFREAYRESFSSADALIFIGACGIAVREIAPYLASKKTDPAVLCIDEKMQFVIPLLSGHIGGANDLARRLAAALGASAVITTATDVNGKFAADAWAAKNECAISSMLLVKKVAAEILERDVPLVSDFPIKGVLPGGIVEKTHGALGIVIGYRTKEPFAESLRLTPKVLHVGIGCRRGTAQETIEAAVAAVLSAHQLDPSAVKGVYSIDLKQQEAGLLAACAKHNWPTVFYTAEELRSIPGEFTDSPFVQEMTGVGNVCERAAMRGAEKLLVKKTAVDGVTVAASIGEDPACVYKTLVTQGNSKNYFVFVIPVAAELDLKAAARSVGEKSVAMIHVADINKVTGYVRGGCSPVGMKKQYTTVFDESVLSQPKVYVSGGRIGTQVCCAPADLIKAARATTAKIIF